LSLDLRERVVAAVLNGLSRRQAAERFGVSPASAVRWCALAATTGSPAASPRGGDRLSHRIEAQAECIHALIAEKDDLTLSEIRARLAEDGHHFAIGTLWRFFARHKIIWKKRPLRRDSRSSTSRSRTASRFISPINAKEMESHRTGQRYGDFQILQLTFGSCLSIDVVHSAFLQKIHYLLLGGRDLDR